MRDKTALLGANLMKISSTMIFKTNTFSLPWRRNLLTLLWLIGFSLFWIGIKVQFE